jgi:hypothetical protein
MEIEFFEPLSRAVKRTRQALFMPFDLNKWLVVGFNAFLAGLADWNHGSGGSRVTNRMSLAEFFDFPRRAWAWLNGHPGWFLAIGFISAFVLALVVALLWLSSRGTFMFLDNVVRNKAEVAAPWKRYASSGDSLFLWRLVFSLVAFGLFAAFGVAVFATGASLYGRTGFSPLPILWIAIMAVVFLLLTVAVGYISLFLKDFVSPLMYKNGVTATRGWSLFLALFDQHALSFIVYGLFIFVLIIAFAMIIIVAGLVTCCIGWFLLVIPYIGTVATLPFWYTLRTFSLEFLAQFGPDFVLLPPAVVTNQSSGRAI